MAKGNPALLPAEIDKNGTVILIGGVREIKTKYTDKQKVIDCQIKTALTEKEYKVLNLTDVADRLKDNTRTWFINGTSFNYLIDTLGDDDEIWNGKEVQIEALMQVVQGERKEILYAKGSV